MGHDSEALTPDGAAARASLSGWEIGTFSAASFGASAVAAFGNAALPLYLAGYGLPNALIGLLAQERSLVGGLAQPVVGAISDRTRTRLGSRRPFFLIGVPLVALTLATLAGHPPLAIVVVLLTLQALFLAVAYDPYLALLADVVPSEQRGRVGGGMAVANMLGQMAILAAASLLWDSHEVLVFALVAAAVVVGFGATFLGVREPVPGGAAVDSPGAPRGSWRSRSVFDPRGAVAYVRGILARRDLSLYVAVVTLFWLGTGGVVPFLTRFGIDELGLDTGTAFLLLLVAALSTALFALPAGALGDRLGKRPVLIAGLLGFGACCLVGAAVQTGAQAFVVLALIGAANAVCTVLLFPLLADLLPPERAGELTGLGSGVWSIAQPLGAVAAGLMADATGTLRGALVLAGLLTLASGLLLTRVAGGRR